MEDVTDVQHLDSFFVNVATCSEKVDAKYRLVADFACWGKVDVAVVEDKVLFVDLVAEFVGQVEEAEVSLSLS